MCKIRFWFFIFIGIILISNISAFCDEGQIDINSASAEKLDEIIRVGESVARYIIEGRPFKSLDDLVEVKYISENYVEDIKNQNLACVSFEEEDYREDKDSELESEKDKNEENLRKDYLTNEENPNLEETSVENEVIILTPKDIKTKSDNEVKNKIGFPFLSLILFCILIGFLYLIREKTHRKNEFKE